MRPTGQSVWPSTSTGQVSTGRLVGVTRVGRVRSEAAATRDVVGSEPSRDSGP